MKLHILVKGEREGENQATRRGLGYCATPLANHHRKGRVRYSSYKWPPLALSFLRQLYYFNTHAAVPKRVGVASAQ